MMRRLIYAVFALAFMLCASAGNAEISIGAKKFTESDVLGEIAARQVQKAGLDANLRKDLGGTIIVWQALQHGDIAAYPEYTATISAEILKDNALTTPESLRKALAKFGIGMTGDLGFTDNYELVMRREQAETLGIKKISDLKNHPELRVAPTPRTFQTRRRLAQSAHALRPAFQRHASY